MPSQPTSARLRSARLAAAARSLGEAIAILIWRVYALALIAVIVWLTFGALRYLIGSLVAPLETPAQIAAVPRRLDAALLRGSRPDWLGLQAAENPRGPLAHYHRFDTWIEADRFNNCTRSGCHSSLPHSRSKELRAFLNMHATSLHCGVCHLKSEAQPLALAWYSLRDGKPGVAPTALRAFAWLDSHSGAPLNRAGQYELRDLLRAAAADAQGDAQLERLARQIEVAHPGGAALTQLVNTARDAVQRAFRGSYGSKLAHRGADGQPVLGHPNSEQAAQDWLAGGSSSTGPAREALLRGVHTSRRDAPLQCSGCHTSEGSLVEFAQLGYPPARVRTLTASPIFEMIRHIGEGRPFHLPTFGGANSPSSQPAKP